MTRKSTILERNNVRVLGQGSRTIMFAHGFGCDQKMWRYMIPAFEQDYRIVVFDYVGSGGSDWAAWSMHRYSSLDGYASDVLEILDSLDLRGVTFVGHSVSSIIGILAANREPDRFSDLILLGPSPRYINDPPYVGGFDVEDIEGLLESMDRNFIGWAQAMSPVVMKNPDRPELTEELEQSFCSTDPTITRKFAEVTFTSDNRQDLQGVTVPSLIVQCSEDSVAPAEVGEYMRTNLPHSDFVQMSATGHCPHMSHPEETIRVIRERLAATQQ
ncbi:MAG: alpha/beta hydrolase [Acidobacteria bacterium]|nr:alpha/beta hydrolase [Acidobacteriota bacterium]